MIDRRVYFARCIGPWGTPLGAIKVGCSHVPESRLKSVATCQPYTIEVLAIVPGGFVMEAVVHQYLRKHRISGEFFHENAFVAGYVDAVAHRGAAFEDIEADPQGDVVPTGAFDGFLKYHGLTIEQVSEYLGRQRVVANTASNKVIAGALLLANRSSSYGRSVQWPADCLRGLLGEVHGHIRPRIEVA
jgi:hypothetical protein